MPTTGVCAESITGALSDISLMMYDIAQADTDCNSTTWDPVVPGEPDLQLGQKACAGDLTQLFADASDLAARLPEASFHCGSIDNLCAVAIGYFLNDFLYGVNALVATTSVCLFDPFLCTYSCLDAINSFSKSGGDLNDALMACNHLTEDVANNIMFRNGNNRRLLEEDAWLHQAVE